MADDKKPKEKRLTNIPSTLKNRKDTFYQRTNEDYAEALRANGGLIKATAKALGVCESAVNNKVKNNPDLEKVMWEARGELGELAVSKLKNAVENGEAWAVKIVLTNSIFGKEQGFFANTFNNINVNSPVTANTFDSLDLSKLTEEELDKLDELTAKAAATRVSGGRETITIEGSYRDGEGEEELL